MMKWRSLVMAAAVAVAFGSTAQAAPISYSYTGVAPNFQMISPDTGFGGIGVIAQSGVGTGPGGGALGALLSAIPSDGNGVGTFTAVGYTMGLTITDDDSPGSPHTFSFNGELNGVLEYGNNTLSNSFTSPTTQSFQIGNNMYTVEINALALPSMGGPGAVTYNVSVSAVPEPSTLLLSGLGAGCVGFFSWRRRRHAERLARASAA